MAEQSEFDLALIILACLALGAAVMALWFLVIVSILFSLLASLAWLGFTVKYPRQSAHYTLWAVMGVSLIIGFILLWVSLTQAGIPVIRSGVLSIIVLAMGVVGIVQFINVPAGTNRIFQSAKIALPVTFAAGLLGWLIFGGGAAYDALYCSGLTPETCGSGLTQFQKTIIFFATFGLVPVIYFPIGFIHSRCVKERKFTKNQMLEFAIYRWTRRIGFELGESPPSEKIVADFERSSVPLPSIPRQTEIFSPPPFGGR